MLSTSFVVASLTTGHKIGLAAVGGSFILFALISSFVLPRRNPNFPGRSVGWFVTLAVLFLIAMLSAVLIFGRESKEAAAEPSSTATTAATTTTATTTGGTTTAATTTAPSSGGQGDAQAGKAVFTSAGCSGCHTLKDAGATGTVGPNLDTLKPTFARAKTQVENGGGPMPAFKGQLSDKQINDVAAYVSSVAGK
jgi:mono/diheme cytochrome c family protein